MGIMTRFKDIMAANVNSRVIHSEWKCVYLKFKKKMKRLRF